MDDKNVKKLIKTIDIRNKKMNVNGEHFRTILGMPQTGLVQVIDQTLLPHQFNIITISNCSQMQHAIQTMQVRGAPLIGAAAAYGLVLALQENQTQQYLQKCAQALIASRPTAVNLRWAVERMLNKLNNVPEANRLAVAWQEAAQICEEDVAQNQAIGQHGLKLIKSLYQDKTFNILTHCNAGWLATVDFGTALAPIYAAHDAGFNVHVWVDETRPRNQGASLTAWELAQHGIPHTVISDNAGGHLMQQGLVDMVIVGADRVTANGDVCNKIGTYLKALSAFDNHTPFYAAVPSPTIDWSMTSGKEIEIEERDANEVAYISGLAADGSIQNVRLIPQGSNAANPAFDVTPARLVTGIITEKGVFMSSKLMELQHA